MNAAACTVTFLFAVERLAVSLVRRKFPTVHRLRDVPSVVDVRRISALEQRTIVSGLLESRQDEPHGESGQGDANSLAIEFFRRYKCGGVAAERIEDSITLVRTGLDDALQQRERLLRWVAETFPCDPPP